jgi:homoserine kinase
MTNTRVTAFAPATVANVASGFDVLGFALEAPGDEVTARLRTDIPPASLVISSLSGGEGIEYDGIPLEPEKNTAGKAALSLLQTVNAPFGVELKVRKMMPAGSGMGSSAASAGAAVVAVNELLRLNGIPHLSPLELIPHGMEGEAVASGSKHADNVGPAITGGILLLRGYDPLDAVQIPVPRRLHCAIVRPHVEVATSMARSIMPKEIPLKTAITQWGNLAGLIAGLMKEDYALIGRSLRDVVAEPVRAQLIPGFHDMKRAALEAGALGCSISGSGPSVFALTDSLEAAQRAASAMQTALAPHSVDSTLYVSHIANTGPRLF